MISILGKSSICHDLSYPLGSETIYWPGGEGFKLCMNCSEDPITKDFYSAGVITCAEHGGTHVDAPFHFAKDGITVDQIPLKSLIAFCHVIDISAKCDAVINTNTGGCDYSLQPEDVYQHESEFGAISEGNIVLIRTGWHRNYSKGAKAYLGFDESVDGAYDSSTSSLSFPGIGPAAARVLIDRKAAAVGLDTASLDPGCSKDFAVHRILLGAGIYGIENVNENISLLPRTGFTLLVMPIKLVGGSGAPARVTAVIH